ncbi:MAG: hypothetical protein BEN18_03875 [Epulopiscium sp. Nuni2H_MBin001]|nr:MAG: hypothetical protein BEN18_03875 [Epulopiscium sp. Nuni2H_MBin001]
MFHVEHVSQKKDKFIRENYGAEGQVMLHETSKKYLNAYKKEHGAVPSSKEIKAILEGLQTNKAIKYEEYKNTITSVNGIANHITSELNIVGKISINIPLISNPRKTAIINAILGFIID